MQTMVLFNRQTKQTKGAYFFAYDYTTS